MKEQLLNLLHTYNKSFIQVILQTQNRAFPLMQLSKQLQQQPFVTAFVSGTLDSNLHYADYTHFGKQYFITDIQVTSRQFQIPDQYTQYFQLDGSYSLLISRNPNQKPIIDVGNFEQIPQGWEPIKIHQPTSIQYKSIFCFKKGFLNETEKCLYQFQIMEDVQEDKIQETTQPSLTQKSQLIHSYLNIELGNMKKYLNFSKKSQIQIQNLRFKPIIQSLFQRKKGQLDIPNMAILCFPEGVRVFRKQTGFKFFTFILTTDCAQRYYCNCITFSQKCSPQTQYKLHQKYGVNNERGIFQQKIFVLISQYNCTDHTNKCLEYLYRIYLSKSQDIFNQRIKCLPTSFTINLQTKKSQFEVEDFGIYFKINSSFPQPSNQAIYSVFKFLQVQKIVTILENLLLERKIFFISKCQNIIGMAIQAFLSFIYPMNWIHGIINPLASSMIEYTEAPMTIIFGVSIELVNKIKPFVEGLYVFLDQNRLQLRNSTEISFMINLRRQLIKRLKQYSVYDVIDVRDYLDNPENLSLFKTQKTEDPHFDAYKIRNIFFQLTVFMLRNYKQYYLKKFKKELNEEVVCNVGGLRRYYDLDALLYFSRRDKFMHTFYQTSLFSVLIQKKRQEPNHKWIRSLDRAIKKISGSKKQQYIQQQSDNYSDTNQPQQSYQLTPKGCLNLISFVSKSSDEQNHPKSSPSPKRNSINQSKYFQDTKYSEATPTKSQGRMSLQNDYQLRHNLMLTQSPKRLSNENGKKNQQNSEKQEKQTDKGSGSCGKSETQIPQLLDNNNQVIIYQFDIQNEDKKGTGPLFCQILSYPYKKLSNSVVTRWTKKKIEKLTSWRKKSKKLKQIQNIQRNIEEKVEKKINEQRYDGDIPMNINKTEALEESKRNHMTRSLELKRD